MATVETPKRASETDETQRVTLFMPPELVEDIEVIAKSHFRQKGQQMVFMLADWVELYKAKQGY